jgi:ParB/RepB/Spo0J family partition protein
MNKIYEIFTDQIDDPHDPMRSELDRDALFDLAENIKANGLINPITVRPVAERFEVVAGHRRLSACKIAGIIKIQCVVRELDDNAAFEVMAAENLERADVDPVDEAIFISNYQKKTGKSIGEIGKALKRSAAWVESRLAVGEMPEYMQAYIKTGQLKLGVALILAQITDDGFLKMWVEQAVRDGISIAMAESWLYDFRRRLLPTGELPIAEQSGQIPAAPDAIMFTCAIDGQRYDTRMLKSISIYEGNVGYFNAFAEAFRAPPPDSELEVGG